MPRRFLPLFVLVLLLAACAPAREEAPSPQPPAASLPGEAPAPPEPEAEEPSPWLLQSARPGRVFSLNLDDIRQLQLPVEPGMREGVYGTNCTPLPAASQGELFLVYAPNFRKPEVTPHSTLLRYRLADNAIEELATAPYTVYETSGDYVSLGDSVYTAYYAYPDGIGKLLVEYDTAEGAIRSYPIGEEDTPAFVYLQNFAPGRLLVNWAKGGDAAGNPRVTIFDWFSVESAEWGTWKEFKQGDTSEYITMLGVQDGEVALCIETQGDLGTPRRYSLRIFDLMGNLLREVPIPNDGYPFRGMLFPCVERYKNFYPVYYDNGKVGLLIEGEQAQFLELPWEANASYYIGRVGDILVFRGDFSEGSGVEMALYLLDTNTYRWDTIELIRGERLLDVQQPKLTPAGGLFIEARETTFERVGKRQERTDVDLWFYQPDILSLLEG